jgi:CheY-like chemotaxis protein
VTASSASPLVLILDDDLGFVMWLGEMFNELGWQTVPALHCQQALTFAKRLKLPLNALVVNPELPSAARTVEALTAANPGVQVVLIRNSADEPDTSGIQAPATLERPSPSEPVSRSDWLSKVRELLAESSGGR